MSKLVNFCYYGILACFVAILIISVATIVTAAEVTYVWDYPDYPDEPIDGFRIYVGSGDNPALDNIGPDKRRAVLALDDSSCQAAYITAYRGGEESHPSDFAVWCPSVPPVRGVLKFELSVQ